jgi:hypothetical protein
MKKAMLLLSIFSFAFAQEVKKEQEPAPADRSLQLRSKYDERLKALQITPATNRSLLNLSLIVDTSFVARNKNDQEFKHLEIPGLYHKHEGNGHGHGALNEKRGFNLNYAELYLYAPVDPYFDLYATIPFSEDGVEVEEAYAGGGRTPLWLSGQGWKVQKLLWKAKRPTPPRVGLCQPTPCV